MNYSVIESYSGDKLLVPVNWVLPSQKHYYWPESCNKDQLDELLFMLPDPKRDWNLLRVKKVHCANVTYDNARFLMEYLNYQARSESENSAKRKIDVVVQSDESDDENVEALGNKKTKSNQQDELFLQNLACDLPSISTSLNNGIFRVLEKIATVVTQNNHEIAKLNEKVDSLIKNRTVYNDDDESTIYEERDWPWTNESQMIEAETCIKEDETELSRTIMILKRIGGIDCNSIVTNILKTTIGDDIAIMYSWAGKKKKKSFIETFPTFVKVISIVSQHHYPRLTKEDIKFIVSRWLKQAKLRIFRAELQKKGKDFNEATTDDSS